jgi:hypothetical protein
MTLSTVPDVYFADYVKTGFKIGVHTAKELCKRGLAERTYASPDAPGPDEWVVRRCGCYEPYVIRLKPEILPGGKYDQVCARGYFL